MARVRETLLAAALTAALIPAASAGAATIAPNTFTDEFNTGASCSLREAVHAANTDAAVGGCPAGSGADTIALASGTYLLSIPTDASPDDNEEGDLDLLGGQITLTRQDPLRTVINGGGVDRILHVINAATSATVSGLNFENGLSTASGGGLRVAGGSLAVSDSTVSGNTANGFGGGFSNSSGTLTLTNVTVTGNRSLTDSGGVDSIGATVLNNVTVTANTADADGNASGQGGGIGHFGGSLSVNNTIVAGNTDRGGESPDCVGTVTSLGNNLIGTTTGCNLAMGVGDKVGVAPLLGPLADNGGPTFTHALLPGSPALNAAGTAAAANDQRGVLRAPAPDIGAYERVLCGGVVVNRVGTAAKETISGTSGPDGILGLAGNDTLLGLAGKDGICGGTGKDILKGGGGKDRLLGQAGRDTLIGGKGKDRCKGGGGKDKQRAC